MDLDYNEYLPDNYPMNAKVWIYPSTKPLGMAEAHFVDEEVTKFLADWKAHGETVKGTARFFFGRFLVFIADETNVKVSGCSIDSSVKFVKTLGERLKVDFFNRLHISVVSKEKIEDFPIAHLQYALENKLINNETLFFDHSITNFYDLKESWLLPIKQSWLSKKINMVE